jgi:hypothetical protein
MTTRRSTLLQREMRSIFIVVPDVFVHQQFQMPLIRRDHMVDQIAAPVANPGLGGEASFNPSVEFEISAGDFLIVIDERSGLQKLEQILTG